LVNLSTATHICLFTFLVFGSLTIKSIDIDSQGLLGKSKGSSSPYLLCFRDLFLWQVSYFEILSITKACSSGIVKFLFIKSIVLSLPQWLVLSSLVIISLYNVNSSHNLLFMKNSLSSLYMSV
jgi:hypothetical protein